MRNKNQFIPIFLLLVIAQLMICNYVHISAYLMLSILPTLILFLPRNISTIPSLLIAFAVGISIDAFGEGLFGLNTIALLPVAYFRKPILSMIFGQELIERNENISLHKYGFAKVSFALLCAESLFLIIYIAADGAGIRSFSFNSIRFIISLISGYLLSLPIINILNYEDR